MSAHEYKALRRLAAAVLIAAAEDYRRPGVERGIRNECAKFLTRDSPWHQIAGLHPDRAARWLRSQIEGTRRAG